MTNAIKSIVLTLVRFAVLWLVDALSILGAAWLLPGVAIAPVGETPAALVAISAALLLAIVNLLIRPVILLIARPLGWIALFIVGFLVNAIALWITAWLLPGLDVSLLGGLLGGIVFAIFNTLLTGILELDEEGSFYQGRIERRAPAAAGHPWGSVPRRRRPVGGRDRRCGRDVHPHHHDRARRQQRRWSQGRHHRRTGLVVHLGVPR